MSARSELHDAITEALADSGLRELEKDRIAAEVLADPRVLPLIEGVGSEERERLAMLGLVAEWRAIAIANGKEGSPVHESCATELEKEVALLRAGPTSEPHEGCCMRCFVAVTTQWVPLCEVCHPRCVKEWYPPTEANEPRAPNGPQMAPDARKSNTGADLSVVHGQVLAGGRSDEPGGGASEEWTCPHCESDLRVIFRPDGRIRSVVNVTAAAPQEEPRQQLCQALPEGAEDNGAPNGVTRRCFNVRPCPIHDKPRQQDADAAVGDRAWEPYRWPQIEMRFEDGDWYARWKFSPFAMVDGLTREEAFAKLLEVTPTLVMAIADLLQAIGEPEPLL